MRSVTGLLYGVRCQALVRSMNTAAAATSHAQQSFKTSPTTQTSLIDTFRRISLPGGGATATDAAAAAAGGNVGISRGYVVETDVSSQHRSALDCLSIASSSSSQVIPEVRCALSFYEFLVAARIVCASCTTAVACRHEILQARNFCATFR